MKKILFALMLIVAAIAPALAQKYGHMNYGNVVTALPATAEADKQMEAFKKTLVDKGEVMSNKLKEDYVAFLKEDQGGTLSPLQKQQKQTALQAQQEAITKYEEEVRTKLQAKRDELIKPITDKVEKAIQDVAKEGAYAMIFDTSQFNAILFAKESEDITPKVKLKLGIK
jgi:outer membrane protein